MPTNKQMILFSLATVTVIILLLGGCGKFNPPWGGSAW